MFLAGLITVYIYCEIILVKKTAYQKRIISFNSLETKMDTKR